MSATGARRSGRCFIDMFVFWGLLAAASVEAAPGNIDPSFYVGRGALSIGPGRGAGILIQPDGKILVGGTFNGIGTVEAPPIVRFNPDGSVDESFDTSALAPETVDVNGATDLVPLALQANGQVLIAPGDSNNSYGARALLRLNADGSVDTGFNPQFGDSGTPHVGQAVVLGDGRILIGGGFESINGVARFYLARLNADGSVDPTFTAARTGPFGLLPTGKLIVFGDTFYRLNQDGSLDSTFSSAASGPGLSSFLVQPDGRVVFSRTLNFFGDQMVQRLNADGPDDSTFNSYTAQFAYVRFLQSDGKIILSNGTRLHGDGTPDATFGPGEIGGSIVQQADGKLVSNGGYYSAPYGIRRNFLDGSLDSSFDPGMGLSLIVPIPIDRACILPDGRIALAARCNYFDNAPRNSLVLLHPDGSLDTSFDSGDLLIDPSTGARYLVNSLVAQSDGKILVAFERRLVRLETDGSVDASFNYAPVSQSFVFTQGVTLQPNGRILVLAADGLVRLLPDGSRDGSFTAAENGPVLFVEPDGKIMVRGGTRRATRLNSDGSIDDGFAGVGGSAFEFVQAMAVQPDGKYLVSRYSTSSFGFLLYRRNHDGSSDPSFDSNIASALHILVDGAGITVGGNIAVSNPTPEIPGVARLISDGARDGTFSPAILNSGASLTALLRQADGRLVATGVFDRVNGLKRPGIVRLLAGPAPDQLANLSTRARVGRREAVAIGGFIVTGSGEKKVMVRALGPSLSERGIPVADTLANPVLELYGAGGALVAQNDDWRTTQAAPILATGLAPTDDHEAVIVATLAPGPYTAVVRGSDQSEGLALVELYDLDPSAPSKLANISTRARVQTGDGVMIGGFILDGTNASTVVVRALGPSLADQGLSEPLLADPRLALHDQSGNLIAGNDDWRQGDPTRVAAYGLAPTDDRESALVWDLPPGPYTAIVRGTAEQAGVALVEIYEVQ